MKVEHLTLGGNAVIRDTSVITPIVRQKLSAIQLGYESRLLTVPALLPLKLKITATDEGAMFDVMKGDSLAILNVCCFEVNHSQGLLELIRQLSMELNDYGYKGKVIEPVTPQWLYSIIINPFVLTPDDAATAGEVELYIYEQLYLAYRKC